MSGRKSAFQNRFREALMPSNPPSPKKGEGGALRSGRWLESGGRWSRGCGAHGVS
jgi:hypothetical protein